MAFLVRPLVWLLRALVFFTLFAFALNNQQPATVHWFFGMQWHAPMVIVVLAAFAAGCAFGMLASWPRAWRHWRQGRAGSLASPSAASEPPARAEAATQAPPAVVRDGL